MKHTEACLKHQKEWAAAQEAYDRAWPNHCPHCGGEGVLIFSENQSPIGSGLNWPMTEMEACSYCLELGKCPRCGADNGEEWCEDDYEPCPKCGWKQGCTSRPGAWECECWMQEWES